MIQWTWGPGEGRLSQVICYTVGDKTGGQGLHLEERRVR